MQPKPESMGISCNIRLCTIAQSFGGPLEGSVIAFMSAANGTGMLNGLLDGIDKQPFGFLGGSIFWRCCRHSGASDVAGYGCHPPSVDA